MIPVPNPARIWAGVWAFKYNRALHKNPPMSIQPNMGNNSMSVLNLNKTHPMIPMTPPIPVAWALIFQYRFTSNTTSKEKVIPPSPAASRGAISLMGDSLNFSTYVVAMYKITVTI